MADFAGTVSLVSHIAPFGGHAGSTVVKIALAAATYGSGDVNLSGIAGKLYGIKPADIKHVNITVNGDEGYMVNYAPASTPTWAAIGALTLRTDTSTAETGTETVTVYLHLVTHPARF